MWITSNKYAAKGLYQSSIQPLFVRAPDGEIFHLSNSQGLHFTFETAPLFFRWPFRLLQYHYLSNHIQSLSRYSQQVYTWHKFLPGVNFINAGTPV